MSQDFLLLDAQDVILDAKTRKIVAIIRNGEVFRDDDGARIAVFVGWPSGASSGPPAVAVARLRAPPVVPGGAGAKDNARVKRSAGSPAAT
jgi:hypothetical protein